MDEEKTLSATLQQKHYFADPNHQFWSSYLKFFEVVDVKKYVFRIIQSWSWFYNKNEIRNIDIVNT